MGDMELNSKYRRLRSELEQAYTAPAWNAPKIDQLADEIAATERALASAHMNRQPMSRGVGGTR